MSGMGHGQLSIARTTTKPIARFKARKPQP
jgi:hypothetical protein